MPNGALSRYTQPPPLVTRPGLFCTGTISNAGRISARKREDQSDTAELSKMQNSQWW